MIIIILKMQDMKLTDQTAGHEIAGREENSRLFIVIIIIFTCVSYAEARNRYRLDVCPSVRHTLVLYQNG